ncbi:MAG: efflux RND transporter periplasmic adaptor subunit, partial [Ignavibacteria bacterium]
EKRVLNITIESNGKIIPSAKGKAEIFSPLPGKIVQSSIPVIGMSVSRGRTLLRIEQTLAVQDKLSIANEKFKAEADYEQALKDFERLKELEGVTAQKELLAAEIKLNSIEKTLGYYEELLSGKSVVNNYFNITSPITGIIVESNISAGEQIDPSKKLLTIVDINNLWVEADIYESDISRLQNLYKANITVQTYPDEIFEGKLVNIGNVVDEKNRTVKVIFLIDNKRKLLKVGMFANVNIETESSSEVIAIPKESVVDIGGKNVVFLHTKPQNFKSVEVFTGRDDGKYIEIISGIEEGNRIVTIGNYQLKANVK